MNYPEWLKTVPKDLTEDSLWRMEAYRLALFAADLAWRDVTKLFQDKRTIELASQLYAAIGSIGANLPGDLVHRADWSDLLTNAPLP